MQRELSITTGPIDEAAPDAVRRMGAGMGAAVYFLGSSVRGEDGRTIRGIEYERSRKW
jgi:hypothetical protein